MNSKSVRTQSVQIFDNFYRRAPALRREFVDRFADDRSTQGDRFIWDHWHVPDQYTALRTPAYHFFSRSLYEDFHNHLVWWGRRTLGCHDISPTWMSCYIEGCKQELHGDLPHGPWAFVYSLTPWTDRCFSGGETTLISDSILQYWQTLFDPNFNAGAGLERHQIFQDIPPLFNRLTVFDPRVPHGVREVRGVQDVRKGRLVIHGWFVQPRPFIEGPLRTKALQAAVDELGHAINQLAVNGMAMTGTLSVRFTVGASGEVGQLTLLSNSLRFLDCSPQQETRFVLDLMTKIRSFSFGKQKSRSSVTLPLVFAASDA